jgi:hypothetical protein
MKDPETYYGGKIKAKGTRRTQLWVKKGEQLLLLVEDDVSNKIVRVRGGSAAKHFALEQEQELNSLHSTKSVKEDAGRMMRILLMKAVLNDVYGADTANRFGKTLSRIVQNETEMQRWVCTPAKLFGYVLECEQHAQQMTNLLMLANQVQKTTLSQKKSFVICDSAIAALLIQQSKVYPELKDIVAVALGGSQ